MFSWLFNVIKGAATGSKTNPILNKNHRVTDC